MLEQYEQRVNVDELYKDETTARTFPIPESTVKTQAATVSLLSGNPNLEEEYRNNYQDILTNGGKGAFGARLQEIADRSRNAYNSALTTILQDPNVDIKQKENALRTSANMDADPLKELAIKLASQRDEGLFNSREQAVISLTQDRINSELEYRDFEQKMRNITALKIDPTFKTVVSDVMEWFVPGSMSAAAFTAQKAVAKEMGIELGLSVGDNKIKIRERLASLPVEQRQQILFKVHDAIANNSGLVFKDKNTLEGLAMLQELAVGSDYGSGSLVLDRVTQVLDAIGLGGVIKGSARATARFFNKAKAGTVVPSPSPVTALPVASSVNPEAARTLYKAASQSDEMAKATSGVSRADLVIHTEAPSVAINTTEVEAKLVDPNLASLATQTGGLRFTDEELKTARETATKKWQSVAGVVPYHNYTQVMVEGDNLVYRGFYGGANMGFETAEEARSSAKYAFKDFGIKDSDMSVFHRTDAGTYEKLTLQEAKALKGEFLVNIDAKAPVMLGDTEISPLTWKLNYFDRFKRLWSRGTGSVTQNLLDSASVQPALLTASAEVAVDRSVAIEKAVLKKGDEFARQTKTLPSAERDGLMKAIVDGDTQKVNWDDLTLRHQFGLSDNGITAYKQFRDAQDTNHWLTNLTHVKNFRNNGWKLFENGTARLFGKEVQKALPSTAIYDPISDTTRVLTRQELDDLYNRGGTLAKLRSEQEFAGVKATHFIVENNPNSYLRVLNDSDQIVNYIPGYFKRFYNSPRFVVVNETASDGTKYERAVAIAGTWEDAQRHLEGLARNAGKPVEEVGRVRADVKDAIELELEAMSQAGMVNQRHRGELLSNAQSPIYVGTAGNVLDPSESFIKAAASISQKVGMQDAVDTMKRRLMAQFKDVMPADGSYPNSLEDIGKRGDMYSKDARDARSLWQYIDSLEAGFYNMADVFSRELFSQISVSAGKKGLTGVEKTANIASEISPMQTISAGLHRALITWNPIRQLLVQPAQAMRLSIYNPPAFAKALADWNMFAAGLFNKRMGKPLSAEQKAIDDMVNRWGGLDGVDRSILVEGPLRTMTVSALPPVVKEVAQGVKAVDKAVATVGFDAGEKLNMFLHMATIRNEYKMLGKDVTNLRVQDEIFAKARAMTLSLNQAGMMPYNRTAVSLFTKFLQIPHKALLQVTTNRRLSMADKTRILAADLMLYGVPMAAVAGLVGKDMLPEDPDLRDKIEFGLLTNLYNKSLENLFGYNPDANLSTLAPYEMSGWRNLINGMLENGLAATFAKTPAGTLTTGSNPRLSKAIQKTMDFVKQNGVEGDPVAFTEVVNEFAKIAGGYNNYVKAKYILETAKIADQRGLIVKEGAGNLEALHAIFGIPFKSVESNFTAIEKMTRDSKNRKKDIEDAVDRTLYLMHEKYQLGTQDFEQSIRIIQEFNRIFTNHEELGIALNHYAKRTKTTDDWLIGAMMKYAGFSNKEDMDIVIKSSGLSEERKNFFREVLTKDIPSLNESDFKD